MSDDYKGVCPNCGRTLAGAALYEGYVTHENVNYCNDTCVVDYLQNRIEELEAEVGRLKKLEHYLEDPYYKETARDMVFEVCFFCGTDGNEAHDKTCPANQISGRVR